MADQDKTDSAEQANANVSASTVGNPQDEDVDRQDSATATGSNPHYSTARDNRKMSKSRTIRRSMVPKTIRTADGPLRRRQPATPSSPKGGGTSLPVGPAG